MLEIIFEIIGQIGLVGFLLTLISKWLPNEKIYAFGKKLGMALTAFGAGKVPRWERIEDFFQNSIGQFFQGLEDGVDSDDPTILPPEDDGPRL